MKKIPPQLNVLEGKMPIVRVTGNYQVTIPAQIRKALRVSIGDFVEVTLGESGGAVITPVELRERLPRPSHNTTEDDDWARAGEAAMLAQYDDQDAAYDKIKL